MLTKNMSKTEIENFLKNKGNFVQIDYLNRFLNESLSLDMKKFVCLKLALIYEKAGMFGEAAKSHSSAASVSITFSDKINNYVKESELYIKAGNFVKSDEAMKKAMNEANSVEKREIFITIKEFYKRQAKEYEECLKKGHAAKIYEKLLEMKLEEVEKEEIRKKLLELYEKLGKTKEYNLLKGISEK